MVTVRSARDEELDEVARLTVEAYAEYRAELADDVWAAYQTELADVAARAERGTILVAEDDGRLVGAAFVLQSREDAGRFYLRYLAVSDEARGRGVGRALMDDAAARARAAGAHLLEWRTGSFMRPAIAMYAAMGHAPVDQQEATTGLTIYRYQLPLR